ncbi:TetR family transcriptional regulator C-terminal domain-containing protein [uncultured Nocardioides sp.]|uniref:TetR/AcrR family transcriptional regulator n=1 Tax=uncultured Nocardioides sp. TaxID=198441 RepID=UPI0026189C4C|nr:TetR family transcriptional regulator C-terminal domain-containing protein [uncultured Nocardioides sp.]
MVRTIDGDERRRLLAEAVWSVVRRDGFEAASVRNVAAEAQLSTGSVRHFFATQADLHRFAMEDLVRSVTQRVRVACASHEDPLEAALAGLGELLPLTDRTREEFLAHLQFVTRASVDEELQPVAAASFDGVQSFCRSVVEGLRAAGRTREGLDVEAAAEDLGALVDGLFLRLLVAPGLTDPDRARAQLRRVLLDLGPTS